LGAEQIDATSDGLGDWHQCRRSAALDQGCYEITYTPKDRFLDYRGKMRVDRSQTELTISGDLYGGFSNIFSREPATNNTG
jgi:hypothetical protein